jgi:hypothetical protein
VYNLSISGFLAISLTFVDEKDCIDLIDGKQVVPLAEEGTVPQSSTFMPKRPSGAAEGSVISMRKQKRSIYKVREKQRERQFKKKKKTIVKA